MPSSDEAQRDQRDFVRGHMVRLTDSQGGVHWVNAFLVRHVRTSRTTDGCAVLLVGSDEVIRVGESPDQVAGRLMQGRICTSEPAGAIGGGLGLLAASLFNRSQGTATAAKPAPAPEPKAAAQPSAKRNQRRKGPHAR